MKTILACTVAVIAALCLSGCSRHRYPSRLAVADSIATVLPDSAEAILRGIAPAVDSAGEDARMYSRLIRLKIDDKRYIIHKSDTAVRRLISYYENGGDKALLPEVYYYAGRVYSDMHDTPLAIDYYHKVLDLTDKEHNWELKGLTCLQLGYLYSDQGLYDKALDMFNTSYSLKSSMSDSSRLVFTIRDIARAYADKNKTDSALAYYKQALTLSEKFRYDDLSAGIHAQIASVYKSLGQYDVAWKHLRPALNYDDPDDVNAVMSIAASLYGLTGKTDSAAICYRRLAKEGSVYGKQIAYTGLADYYAAKGDAAMALALFDKCRLYSDSVNKITATEAVARMNALYDYSRKEKQNMLLTIENKERKRQIIYILTISVLIVLTLASSFFYVIERNRALRCELDAYEEKAKRLKTDSRREKILNTDIYRHIDGLVKGQSNRRKLTDDDWNRLSAAVNECYDGFEMKLARLCRISTADYHVCLLLKIKLKLKDIAELSNLSMSGLSSVRTKLYFRAFKEKGSAGKWDELIDSL